MPSTLRQQVTNIRQPELLVRSYSITHPPGTATLPTQPGWDQLLFAPTGLFTARSANDAWTIPRHRAIGVSDGITLQLDTTRRTAIRCLYFASGLEVLPAGVRILSINRLCNELFNHAVTTAPMTLDDPADRALITLLEAQLDPTGDDTLQLPLPTDPTARELAEAAQAHPAASLTTLLERTHAHRRTIERRFRQETAMTLGQWHRRARILHAIALLADGASVTHVAGDVGYASPSAFVAAFRSELGSPPRRYIQPD